MRNATLKFGALVLLVLTALGGAPVPWACAAEPPHFPASLQAQKKFYPGEKMTFSITYFGVPFGRVTSEVKAMTEVRGRRAYHIVLRVWSTPIVDLIHKVRGEHHTFIDAEKLCSLRYEIRSSEDPSRILFEMNLDPEKNEAEYHYVRKGIRKRFPARPGSQDRLSLGYFFRTLDAGPGQSFRIPVHTEQKAWEIPVRCLKAKPLTLGKAGRFEALEAEPSIAFISALNKPGMVRGWISLDERRIPLKISAKAPLVGHVTVTLKEYIPGEEPR